MNILICYGVQIYRSILQIFFEDIAYVAQEIPIGLAMNLLAMFV
jgi:hypothetical protein